jgi:hypothetical protein
VKVPLPLSLIAPVAGLALVELAVYLNNRFACVLIALAGRYRPHHHAAHDFVHPTLYRHADSVGSRQRLATVIAGTLSKPAKQLAKSLVPNHVVKLSHNLRNSHFSANNPEAGDKVTLLPTHGGECNDQESNDDCSNVRRAVSLQYCRWHGQRCAIRWR